MGNRKIQHRVKVLTDYTVRLYFGGKSFLFCICDDLLEQHDCKTMRGAYIEYNRYLVLGDGAWKLRLDKIKKRWRREGVRKPFESSHHGYVPAGMVYLAKRSWVCMPKYSQCVAMEQLDDSRYKFQYVDGFTCVYVESEERQNEIRERYANSTADSAHIDGRYMCYGTDGVFMDWPWHLVWSPAWNKDIDRCYVLELDCPRAYSLQQNSYYCDSSTWDVEKLGYIDDYKVLRTYQGDSELREFFL